MRSEISLLNIPQLVYIVFVLYSYQFSLEKIRVLHVAVNTLYTLVNRKIMIFHTLANCKTKDLDTLANH